MVAFSPRSRSGAVSPSRSLSSVFVAFCKCAVFFWARRVPSSSRSCRPQSWSGAFPAKEFVFEFVYPWSSAFSSRRSALCFSLFTPVKGLLFPDGCLSASACGCNSMAAKKAEGIRICSRWCFRGCTSTHHRCLFRTGSTLVALLRIRLGTLISLGCGQRPVDLLTLAWIGGSRPPPEYTAPDKAFQDWTACLSVPAKPD